MAPSLTTFQLTLVYVRDVFLPQHSSALAWTMYWEGCLKSLNVDFMTVSWLNEDGSDAPIIQEIVPPTGYEFIHEPRPGRGGGVAIIHKKSVDAKKGKS